MTSPCFLLSHTSCCLLPFSFLVLPQPMPACLLSFSFLVLTQPMLQPTPPTLFPSPTPIPLNPCLSLPQSSRSSDPPKAPRHQIKTRQRRQIKMSPLHFTACRQPIDSVPCGSKFVKFFCSSWVWVCEICSWWFSGCGLKFMTRLWYDSEIVICLWFGFGFMTCLWFWWLGFDVVGGGG